MWTRAASEWLPLKWFAARGGVGVSANPKPVRVQRATKVLQWRPACGPQCGVHTGEACRFRPVEERPVLTQLGRGMSGFESRSG